MDILIAIYCVRMVPSYLMLRQQHKVVGVSFMDLLRVVTPVIGLLILLKRSVVAMFGNWEKVMDKLFLIKRK